MSVTLTKREIAWSRIGPVMGAKVPLIHYRVDGLPPEEKAYIANFGGFPCEDRWRVFHIKRGIKAHWDGDYETADDALAALQSEILERRLEGSTDGAPWGRRGAFIRSTQP